MRQLRLVGLNEDGSRLLLRDEAAKIDYVLPNDERLTAALRGDRARLGQLEINLESQLRPREMQARVRAGQSPEQVAKAAGLPLDKVMRMVGPIIAERENVVSQARKATVRRVGADGPGLVLEPTVGERLAAKGVQPDSATWDARRRDDGAWLVEIGYELDGRHHQAAWTYDATAKAATPVDDEARALSGVRPPVLPPVLFAEEDDDARADAPAGQPRLMSVRGGSQTSLDVPGVVDADADAEITDGDDAEPDTEAGAGDGAASRGRGAKRATVPTWDEIMFGRRRTRD